MKKQILNTYYYKVFGLVLQSELELPELRTSEQTKPDIHIRIGPTPAKLKKVDFKGALFECSLNEFLFSNDIVSFYIKNGKSILLEPKNKASHQDIRLFLLGTGMGVVILQRGLLPLHGSSIVHDNRAYIFSGASTSGKSSLAAALAQKGYNVLADDISVVKKDENGLFIVYPGIPHIKIWKDVQNILNFADVKNRVRPHLEKYFVSNQIEFCNEPVPLEMICVLNIKHEQGFEYTKLTGAEKFNNIRNNTFRIRILDSSGLSETHFQTVSNLANSIKVYRINRPSIPLNINELANYIERYIILKSEL